MKRIGRNDPCTCGSGKRSKQCCFQLDKTQIKQDDLLMGNSDLFQAALGHHQAGRLPQAESIYRKILQAEPNHAEALHFLGVIAHQAGRDEIAVDLISKAINISPSSQMYSNLGAALYAHGKLDEAEVSYRRALEIKPDFADVHYSLGLTLNRLGKFNDAVVSYRLALEIKPDFAEAHGDLGNALQNLGQLDSAQASYRRALEIKPDFAEVHSNLIFYMDMSATAGLPELQRERIKWDQAHAAPLWREPVHSNDRSPDRRLRVGYVSGDLRDHSAAKGFTGLLTRYDRSQFDVYAYSNYKGKGDNFTELFKQNVTVWRNIGGLPDDAVAKMIREDKIDILVDLSGHSAGNRLLVFARKPAPIQITGWGYGTSTGMRVMDVFFTDPVVVPPEDRQYFTEEVRYLSSVAAPFFIGHYPEVNELPALSDGVITFGSFNRLAKVSDKAYRAWAEVLLAVPHSRLVMKAAELDDAASRERVAGHFTKAGVAADRIIMRGGTSWGEHVQAYNQIDLALDPFPHGGGVTTLEGLMMGVPVITLRWPTIAGRVSASIMTVLGLTDWIAETQEEYVALAIQKAKDVRSLAALRQQLRSRVTSVIGDQEAYARNVEQEYRVLWQRWCASGSPDG